MEKKEDEETENSKPNIKGFVLLAIGVFIGCFIGKVISNALSSLLFG